MSTSHSPNVERAVAACRPTDVTPVSIAGDALDSLAPSYLRDLKAELADEGYQPATLAVSGCFAEDCSLATQEEADRLRRHVRAAAFLGASRLELAVDEVSDPEKVRPALSALEERARREGVRLALVGDADVSLRTTA
ncbi:apurinic/apyrimidinic endonuclease family protein [Halegenticoccus soli]|uniref:TIM barrel protein n=1 Tax=Halegenticoccus soli TaxID=1985678 RepID=UPI000C6D1296|nr:TIM barrel protein [Halegenticoccus soli]